MPGASQDTVPDSNEVMTRSYEVKRSHQVYKSLLRQYGREQERRSSKKRNADVLEEEECEPPAKQPRTDSTNGGEDGESC